METMWLTLLVASATAAVYPYAVYPVLLKMAAVFKRRPVSTTSADEWPDISITIPAYNEEARIRETLESILELDYPADKRQILVISDASTDRTNDIVREFADRGVELVVLAKRAGKTAAENAGCAYLSGDILVNTDASVRIHPAAIKPLVATFTDPTVGVASGRDVSVARVGDSANLGESGYVGYEMWVRSLETRVGGIVGASGCFYASRMDLHMEIVPEALSRDFAAPLIARENGYRSVSVNDAVCFVPRSTSLRQEYRRKVRTMARGLETLFFRRRLLDPVRYGSFAWMLFSHKLARWLVPWAVLVGAIALIGLAPTYPWARWALGAAGVVGVFALVGWFWPARSLPRVFAMPAYVVSGLVAGLHAWTKAMRGELNPIWEPTRRESVGAATPH